METTKTSTLSNVENLLASRLRLWSLASLSTDTEEEGQEQWEEKHVVYSSCLTDDSFHAPPPPPPVYWQILITLD